MSGEGRPHGGPVEWSVWPPPLLSRAERRACAKVKHHGIIKMGYCGLCGTRVGGK